MSTTDTTTINPTRRPIEILLTPTRDGESWRARVTGSQPDGTTRTVEREGYCAEDPHDTASLVAREAVGRWLDETAATEDGVTLDPEPRELVLPAPWDRHTYTKGAYDALAFLALADDEDSGGIDSLAIERSQATHGVDLLVWREVRGLPRRAAVRALLRALSSLPPARLPAPLGAAVPALLALPRGATRRQAIDRLEAAGVDTGIDGYKAQPHGFVTAEVCMWGLTAEEDEDGCHCDPHTARAVAESVASLAEAWDEDREALDALLAAVRAAV